jgi:hypothetical protein
MTMELAVGPFDPALHIRSRDHYEAVLREAKLLSLQAETPPLRFERLIQRLTSQFPPSPLDEIADRAYLAGEPEFRAVVQLPDEMIPAALAACDDLEALLDDLDRWADNGQASLLRAHPDVRAYASARLAQARAQLEAAEAGPA